MFEYWAHEASFLPVRLQPFLRWRMAAAEQHAWGNMVRLQQERPGYVAEVLERVRADGPLKASDLAEPRPDRPGAMWNWHAGKVALEWLFFTGEITATHRTTAFEKVYDLTERVLPPDDPADADTRAGRRRPGAGPHGRPGAGRGHRARPARLLPAAPGGRPARPSPSWPTPGSCCRSRWPAGVRRRGWTRRPAGPAGSARGRC